jgi:hypothetical protein
VKGSSDPLPIREGCKGSSGDLMGGALALLATIILSKYFAKFVDISSGIGLKFHNVYKKHESKKLEVSKLSFK